MILTHRLMVSSTLPRRKPLRPRFNRRAELRASGSTALTTAVGNKKPSIRQLHSMAGVGAVGGAFWGFLLGLIFFVPLLGAAIGAGMGALTGSLGDIGIDDDFIKQVKEEVTKGDSAFFTLTSEAKLGKMVDELRQYDFEVISTNLSAEQEQKFARHLSTSSTGQPLFTECRRRRRSRRLGGLAHPRGLL
jgi:uncharacterized membrane protein